MMMDQDYYSTLFERTNYGTVITFSVICPFYPLSLGVRTLEEKRLRGLLLILEDNWGIAAFIIYLRKKLRLRDLTMNSLS